MMQGCGGTGENGQEEALPPLGNLQAATGVFVNLQGNAQDPITAEI
jgi:hypothetical protein